MSEDKKDTKVSLMDRVEATQAALTKAGSSLTISSATMAAAALAQADKDAVIQRRHELESGQATWGDTAEAGLKSGLYNMGSVGLPTVVTGGLLMVAAAVLAPAPVKA
jgi:hypothetical protein